MGYIDHYLIEGTCLKKVIISVIIILLRTQAFSQEISTELPLAPSINTITSEIPEQVLLLIDGESNYYQLHLPPDLEHSITPVESTFTAESSDAAFSDFQYRIFTYQNNTYVKLGNKAYKNVLLDKQKNMLSLSDENATDFDTPPFVREGASSKYRVEYVEVRNSATYTERITIINNETSDEVTFFNDYQESRYRNTVEYISWISDTVIAIEYYTLKEFQVSKEISLDQVYPDMDFVLYDLESGEIINPPEQRILKWDSELILTTSYNYEGIRIQTLNGDVLYQDDTFDLVYPHRIVDLEGNISPDPQWILSSSFTGRYFIYSVSDQPAMVNDQGTYIIDFYTDSCYIINDRTVDPLGLY